MRGLAFGDISELGQALEALEKHSGSFWDILGAWISIWELGQAFCGLAKTVQSFRKHPWVFVTHWQRTRATHRMSHFACVWSVEIPCPFASPMHQWRKPDPCISSCCCDDHKPAPCEVIGWSLIHDFRAVVKLVQYFNCLLKDLPLSKETSLKMSRRCAADLREQ